MPDQPQRLLAFDFGLRQIGCASGLVLTGTATPQQIFKAREGQPNWDEVEQFIRHWKPDAILVGLPLNMDGTESQLSGHARKFANRLHGRTGLRILMVDERLSSREAKALAADDRRISRTEVDHYAAALIMETWFSDPGIAQPI